MWYWYSSIAATILEKVLNSVTVPVIFLMLLLELRLLLKYHHCAGALLIIFFVDKRENLTNKANICQ